MASVTVPSTAARRGPRGRRGLETLLLGALLLGAGGARAAEPIGAARCGTCHPRIYAGWRSSPHARSMDGLSEREQADPTCRACHTLAPASDDPALAGVQCESCHGEGSEYAPEAVMRDPRLARLLGLVDVDAGTCRACHEGVEARLEPIDYARMLKAVGHAEVLDAEAR